MPAIDPAADPTEVAALARRLLDAVVRSELVADDALRRRVVLMWEVLAENAESESPGG